MRNIFSFIKRNFSKPVDLGRLNRLEPISRIFGLDRGMPIDRYYIEVFLNNNAEFIKGRVLEVGESYYSKRYGGKRVRVLEVLHSTPENKNATLIGNLTNPATLPENQFDCFICTQTLNFIFDVQKAIEGCHYLLKPGGVLLATVSGISQISRYDMERWGDYWRFTTQSVRNLFEQVFKGGLEIASYGNVLAATAFLQGLAVKDLPNRDLLDHQDKDYQIIIAIKARKDKG